MNAPTTIFFTLVGVLIGMLFVFALTFNVVENHRVMVEKIAVCEKDLPRSQHCALTAVPASEATKK
jgi:hypothetical protein